MSKKCHPPRKLNSYDHLFLPTKHNIQPIPKIYITNSVDLGLQKYKHVNIQHGVQKK